MKSGLIICCLLTGLALTCAGQDVIEIKPGKVEDDSRLRYGWSYSEILPDGTSMRWIEKSEAEIVIPLTGGKAYTVELTAMPIHFDARIQNVGIFLNHHFIKEWLMNTNVTMNTYTAVLPAKWVRDGENRIIFRVGYKHRPDNDPRSLSVAVECIRFVKNPS